MFKLKQVLLCSILGLCAFSTKGDVFVSASSDIKGFVLGSRSKEKVVIYQFGNNKKYRCALMGNIKIENVTSIPHVDDILKIAIGSNNNVVIESLRRHSKIYQVWIQIDNSSKSKQSISVICKETGGTKRHSSDKRHKHAHK